MHITTKYLLVTTLMVIVLMAKVARADNAEGYESKIEGVGLWFLHEGNNPVRFLRFGENPEYAAYCDGKNSLYIYEKASAGFPCKTEYWEQYQGNAGWEKGEPYKRRSPKKKELIQIVEQAQRDRYSDAGESKYYVSLQGLSLKEFGIYTVSKTKLLLGNWRKAPLSGEDIRHSQKLANAHIKEISREQDLQYVTVIGLNNKKLEEKTTCSSGQLKIDTERVSIILIPTLFDDGPVAEITSSVIAKDGNGYRFIGHIIGCLHSIGADLDSDGIPEVLMRTESTESIGFGYYKVFPKIRHLIGYFHS